MAQDLPVIEDPSIGSFVNLILRGLSLLLLSSPVSCGQVMPSGYGDVLQDCHFP